MTSMRYGSPRFTTSIPRWMAALTGTGTRWRPVDSFAAGIAAAGPALSVRELELHDMVRWAAQGRDPALSPVAQKSWLWMVGSAKAARVSCRNHGCGSRAVPHYRPPLPPPAVGYG